jgi:two-component system sensor histidine kinase BaeS
MPEPAGRRAGLAARLTGVTVGVALLAVVITGAVLFGLVRGASEAQAQETLGRQADLLVTAIDRQLAAQRPALLTSLLRRQDIDVALADPSAGEPAVLDDAQRSALAAGQPVSAVVDVDGGRLLVEARPLDSGRAVVLSQPTSAAGAATAEARRRLLVPLLLGLVVAAVVGWLLARWLARPLQQAAAAAQRLAGGDRDVRLTAEGPAEVAELAEAMNGLGTALAAAEAREREFLLSVSHELRTPLTAVRGYAEALADGLVPAEDVPRTGATVQAEAERLDRLVSDLLDLARLGSTDLRLDVGDVDLAALVAQAGTVWADRCAREGVPLRVELPAAPLVVRTDPTRVRQVVDGLAENALRVTPAGAPVVLAVRAEPGGALLEVRDGGPGLTDDDLRVAFDRSALYQRYRGVRRVGTGLGLAIVAGLARRLGGTATAGRAVEGGAAFRVWLPGPDADAG